MKLPASPYLEFQFYRSNTTDYQTFRELIQILFRLGAKSSGYADAFKGQKASTASFGFAYLHEVPTGFLPLRLQFHTQDFDELFSNPDLRIYSVYLQNAVGIIHNCCEIVSYIEIPEDIASLDFHPVGILTSADPVTGYGIGENSKSVLKTRKKALDRFFKIIQVLSPSYAAITIEYPLEPPQELKRLYKQGISSGAFYNFYVSGKFLGLTKIQQLLDAYQDAFIVQIANGYYISCQNFLNPDGIQTDYQQMESKLLLATKLISQASGKA